MKKKEKNKIIDFAMSEISFYLKPDGDTIKMTTSKRFPLNNKIKNFVFLIGVQICQDMRIVEINFRIDEQYGYSQPNKTLSFWGYSIGYIYIK
jgi:exoribonuclease R